MTFAILSSLGKTPWIRDKFKICVSDCTYISPWARKGHRAPLWDFMA